MMSSVELNDKKINKIVSLICHSFFVGATVLCDPRPPGQPVSSCRRLARVFAIRGLPSLECPPRRHLATFVEVGPAGEYLLVFGCTVSSAILIRTPLIYSKNVGFSYSCYITLLAHRWDRITDGELFAPTR